MKRKFSARHVVALAPLALLISLSETRDSAAEKSHQQAFNASLTGLKGDGIAASAEGNVSVQLPEKGKAEDRELPPAAFEKLVIHAGFGWGIFSGTLYNGNSDYTVTGVTVSLTPAKGNGNAEDSPGGTEYDLELNIEPLAKTALSMPVPSDNTLEYSWKITKARGYKTP